MKKQLQKLKIILLKIQRGLRDENINNQEMVKTYYKIANKQATHVEIQKANAQFQNLLKGVGLGFLIILPFAPISLPFYIRLGKFFNIDLLPTWAKILKKKKK